MSPGERTGGRGGGGGRGEGRRGGRSDRDRAGGTEPEGPRTLFVWQLGEALLAVALDRVVEVAPVGPDGKAATRRGAIELLRPPGLPPSDTPVARAVVLTVDDRPVAVAADAIEGVRECDAAHITPPPAWLGGLAAAGLPALVRLDDQRVAALLEPSGLVGPS